MKRLSTFALLTLFSWSPVAARARVVINEILYRAPAELAELQFVELHNTGSGPVDLAGWSLGRGIEHRFRAGTRIDAGGFVVVCRNPEVFRAHYPVPVAGPWVGALAVKGDRLELRDAAGTVVDAVRFKARPPWPMGPDGGSGSLERICPEGAGDDPGNWVSSPLSADREKSAGTPGRVNAGFSPRPLPPRAEVSFSPKVPAPDEAVQVTASLEGDVAVEGVTLRFRLAGPGVEKPEDSLPMRRTAAGGYTATIPGQAGNQLIRFRVDVAGMNGTHRSVPAETEPRPAFSAYVRTAVEEAAIPFVWVFHTDAAESRAAKDLANQPKFGFGPGMFFGGGPGPGPGPDPAEEARSQARGRLERELNLAAPWYVLTAGPAGPDAAAVIPLREAFRAKRAERDRLIEDVVGSDDIERRLEGLGGVIDGFYQRLSTSLRPRLAPAQAEALAGWIEGRSKVPAPAASMILRRVDLEGLWQAVTLNGDVDPGRFEALRRAVRDLDKRRGVLIADTATGRGAETGFRDQREQADGLRDGLAGTLGPLLGEAQTRAFEEWQQGPRPGPRPAGFRPAGDGPPGGGPPGPGGFGGGGPGGFAFGPPGGPGGAGAAGGSHRATVVTYDPAGGAWELFDFVQTTSRKGGQKLHFLHDQPMDGMTSVNLIFEGEMATLVEPLAYEVYRRSGMAAERSHHVRLWQEGQPAGYHLLIEQPNRAFLRHSGLPDDGNLYKLLWFESGVAGQHEKKTHPGGDHADIEALVEALEKTTDRAQWEVIRRNFDVEQVATYFAVNLVLSHWDGFFNNYFTYHDTQASGKWTVYPWDQDQTWGVVMGPGGGEVFHDMPITFGMKGDEPPGGGGGFGGFGGWWRPPGWFSGPLLANPWFRRVYLARVRDIVEHVYTEATFLPIIDDLEKRLVPEARIRAEVLKEDPARAVAELMANLQHCREHLKLRRKFLLEQKDVREAQGLPRSELVAPAVR